MITKTKGRNPISEAMKDINDWYTPPPEARRAPLLKALEEAWDLAPSMRLTQLLMCAKVFPNCTHNSPVWSMWDEETTKKLQSLIKDFKKQGLKPKAKNDQIPTSG